MPNIGIIQHNGSNTYLFTAADSDDGNTEIDGHYIRFTDVAIYNKFHSVLNESISKIEYEAAILKSGGKKLFHMRGDISPIFTGNEAIPILKIDQKSYDDIFDHLNDEDGGIKQELEYERALAAAFDAGFDGKMVNGRPMTAHSS